MVGMIQFRSSTEEVPGARTVTEGIGRPTRQRVREVLCTPYPGTVCERASIWVSGVLKGGLSYQLWNHGFVYGPFNKLPSMPGQVPEVAGTDWVALDHFFEPSVEACGLPAAR